MTHDRTVLHDDRYKCAMFRDLKIVVDLGKSHPDVARTTPVKDRMVNPGVMEMPRGKWDAIKITRTPLLRPAGIYFLPFVQLLK